MTIRKATTSDAEPIRNLLVQLGYPDFTIEEVAAKISIHQAPGYRLDVAIEADHVVAFIALHWFEQMHHHERIGRISAFCVDEKWRSRQVGRKMLRHAEEVLTEAGCHRVEVTSNNARGRAHKFYLSNGYDEPSRRFARLLGHSPTSGGHSPTGNP